MKWILLFWVVSRVVMYMVTDVPQTHWQPLTRLCSVTTMKTTVRVSIAMETSDLR
jgi:hypothetical protein